MRALCGLGLGLALLLPAPRAEACSCSVGPTLLWPRGLGPEPRNTNIWVEWRTDGRDRPDLSPPEVELEGPSGPVALGRQIFRRSDTRVEVHRFIPERALEPGTYQILDRGRTVSTFEVQDEYDDEHRLTFTSREQFALSHDAPEVTTCGGAFFSFFDWAPVYDDVLVLARLESDPSGIEASDVVLSGLSTALYAEGRLGIGQAYCGADLPAEPGAALRVAFGALDRAGNFSGWTDAVDARVPSETDPSAGPKELPGPVQSGCAAVGPGSAGPLFLLALVFGLGRRRRFRPPSPRAGPRTHLGPARSAR